MSDPYQDHPNVSPGTDSVWSSRGGTTQWVAGSVGGGSSPAFTVTNPTTNTTLNETGYTLDQLAQVLGTVITALQARGIFG